MTNPYLSIIVPLYNEEDNVEPLVEQIQRVVDSLSFASELLLVDDGSQDHTFELAENLCARFDNLSVIRFTRNYGQTQAMVAGLQAARGEILLTMDGDLQNDPADIPMLVAKIEEGYSLVLGQRKNRQDKFITRAIPSKIANWLIAKVTGLSIKDTGCTLKAYRSELIQNIPLYSEMHRFIPAMSSIADTRICEVPVRHHPRQFGESKYGLKRIWGVLADLIGVRALISAVTHPSGVFVIPSLVLLIPTFGLLIVGLMEDSLVFLSASALCFAGALIFLSYGLLAELVVSLGDVQSSKLAGLTQLRRGKFFGDTS